MGVNADMPAPGARLPGGREALAGERDREADQREAPAGEREQRPVEQARVIETVAERLAGQSQDLIEKSRALMAGDDAEAGPPAAAEQPRPHEERHGQEEAPAGMAAGSGPAVADGLTGPAATIERAVALRSQLWATLAALAATEDEVARIHEQIAAGRGSGADGYRRTASEARARARQLRELRQRLRG